MSATTVMVSYRVLPGHGQTALREIGHLVAAVEGSEPDCLGISVLQDAHDPTRITLLERWSSEAAFVGPHMQQPHLQDFIRAAGAFLAGPPEISFWSTVERA